MTTHDDVWMTTDSAAATRANDLAELADVPWRGRIWARLFAGRYDAQVESRVRPEAGTPLAAHCARLTSRRERRELEAALTTVLQDAGLADGGRRAMNRIPVEADAVRHCADLVFTAIAQLAGPLPIRRRGVARLRVLLSDGGGPLYRCGTGSLAAAMRGVLAAM